MAPRRVRRQQPQTIVYPFVCNHALLETEANAIKLQLNLRRQDARQFYPGAPIISMTIHVTGPF